jgi:phytoene synthase
MSDAADLDATDLDGQLRAADPDRWLASRFIADPLARADVVAIYAFDHELARAPRVASNPLIGEMRLAWWREALDAVVSRRKLPRELLEAMIDARYRELDPAPMDAAEASRWAGESAGSAAVLSAYILDPGGEPEAARQAGAAWALHRLGGQAELLRTVLKDARRQVRRLSIAAFPAAAPAALAGSSSPSKLRKQLRLTWAVARGRL